MAGNGGTGDNCKMTNIALDFNNFSALVETVRANNISLVVVGPEQPLVDGIADHLQQEVSCH